MIKEKDRRRKMFLRTVLFYLVFFYSVNSQFQINFHLTNWTQEDENVQHDCLHVPADIKRNLNDLQIISYCMGEFPSKFQIKENHIDQKLTFAQLAKEHVTTEQLYHWSAPIDLIEQYQFYLNSEQTSLSDQTFYNCTSPYFGPQCQYLFNFNQSAYSSLNEIIYDYYRYHIYEPTLFTCYMHLECNRGPSPSCLDWTEICDGRVDCLDGNQDEEHCWQLEIHQCNANEYQCFQGQCIPKIFKEDYQIITDCFDKSDDELPDPYTENIFESISKEPIFRTEDISCNRVVFQLYSGKSPLTSSCIQNRQNLLKQTMFSIKPDSLSNECWTAVKCITQNNTICKILCDNGTCDEIIKKICPDLIYAPAVPILYGHIYLVLDKNQLIYGFNAESTPKYICFDSQRLHVMDDNNTILSSNNDTCRLYENASSGMFNWEQ